MLTKPYLYYHALGSWHTGGRSALEEYKERRIGEAVFIDIDELSDQNNELPHMLPSANQFSHHVGKLGISNDSHVIVYDNNETFGMFSAARLWWMFKVFGHKNVSILDGGLQRWLSDGLPVEESTVPDTKKLSYHAKVQSNIIRSMKDVEKAIRDGDIQVVDARSNERFDGVVPEPRPGLCSGHMISSINLPFYNLFDKNSKTLASKSAIEQEFLKAGVDLNKPIIATCGSGVTACWISLAASLLGKEIPVYDGSWTEYVQYGPIDTIKLGISSNTL